MNYHVSIKENEEDPPHSPQKEGLVETQDAELAVEGFYHWENPAKGIYMFVSKQRLPGTHTIHHSCPGEGTEEDFGTRVFTVYSCEIFDVFMKTLHTCILSCSCQQCPYTGRKWWACIHKSLVPPMPSSSGPDSVLAKHFMWMADSIDYECINGLVFGAVEVRNKTKHQDKVWVLKSKMESLWVAFCCYRQWRNQLAFSSPARDARSSKIGRTVP